MKVFLKIFGAILFGLVCVFGVTMYLAFLCLSVYITVAPWTTLGIPWVPPLPAETLELKIFISFLGVIMLLTTLTCIYSSLDAWVNPCSYPIVPRPTRKRKEDSETSQPILP